VPAVLHNVNKPCLFSRYISLAVIDDGMMIDEFLFWTLHWLKLVPQSTLFASREELATIPNNGRKHYNSTKYTKWILYKQS